MKRLSERVKTLFAEYGTLGLIVWYAVFGSTLAGAAALIEFGVDWPWLEEKVGGAGTWAGAYVITKATMPARVALVAGVLPFLARWRRRLIGRGAEAGPAADP